MKTYWHGDKLHAVFTLELDGGEWSISRSGRFTPRKEALVTIGQEAGWAPRVGLNAVEKKKFSTTTTINVRFIVCVLLCLYKVES
jgi:hypothetical protein